MATIWYRTKTLTVGTNAIGLMKMSLFDGWTMADLSGKLLTELFTYTVTNPWTRV